MQLAIVVKKLLTRTQTSKISYLLILTPSCLSSYILSIVVVLCARLYYNTSTCQVILKGVILYTLGSALSSYRDILVTAGAMCKECTVHSCSARADTQYWYKFIMSTKQDELG